ncbi:MAG: transcription-repair coupling factor [Actinobacteria bacterium]|nr:transcription-repair coupling factor [Actinomycetota bacterium]
MGELKGLLPLWDRTDILDEILLQGEAGVPEIARPFTVAGLSRRASPLMVVLPRSRDAEAFAQELRGFLDRDEVALYPAWEVLPGEALSPTLDTMGRRIRVLHQLKVGRAPAVIVTSVRAFVQKVAPMLDRSIVLKTGAEVASDGLTEELVDLGYERNYLVERPGEFSIRGGIIDIFPPGLDDPVRVDMFGDDITEMRSFSVSSQRSLDPIEEVEILAADELILDEGTRSRAEALAIKEKEETQKREDLGKIAEGISFPGMESYIALLAPELKLVSDWLPDDGRVIVCDPKQTGDRAAEFLEQAEQWDGEDTRSLFVTLSEAMQDSSTVELWPYRRAEEGIDLEISGWDEFVGSPQKLVQALTQHRSDGATVTVAAGTSVNRAQDVLGEAGLGLPAAAPSVGAASISTELVNRGFLLREGPGGKPILALVGLADLFGRRRAVSAERRESPARASALLLELASGDHVVHETYGVGRYHGMITREVGGISRDYLVISYAGEDRLYLPTEQLETITKYSGGESPRLNRLGTAEWEKAKSRARRAVADIAGELILLYSKRQASQGHPFAPDSPWQRELEGAFPFIETPDQARAIEEVKVDMEKPIPMDRLICGDVGYGKTEIAVRAAFKAVQDSKQVAVLVPTTILAQQHTQTFGERFAGFPIKVAQLSRFLTPSEQQEVLEGLAAGKVDVVIGTHRLLQPDVKFNELGLLVVDEEQRFGVKHKETIKKMRESVDVITMTATPIPRTLEMGITGIRDISIIDTPPAERRPVLTFVGEHDERMVTAAIRRELARDGQVFLVHNRVRSIKGAARKIAGLVPGARIEVAHGQMSEAELERVMVDVWDGKIDVLVCTTIIESGLDIPAMNTLIVERADLLGLSQLYQLRGRVGRARERAYAYFFYPHETVLSDEAHERLKILSEFTELGSGFKIALRDLEIRGAGNLLGAEQSGHVAAVGFDLYVRMMTEAVDQLSGREQEPKVEVRIDIPVDAYIPSDYIARESLRMEAYRQIERIRSAEDARLLREELVDRYGAMPASIENLFTVAEVRAFMAAHGIEELSIREGAMKLRPVELSRLQAIEARKSFNADYKDVSSTLLIPAPSSDLAGWVLNSLDAILGEQA